MSDRTPCAHCPVRSGACPAVSGPIVVRRQCELVDPTNPDDSQRERYAALLVAKASGERPAIPPRIREPRPARPTVPEMAERLALVHACDYRGAKAEGCGCSGARLCGLGKGKGGKATLHDCLECVQA